MNIVDSSGWIEYFTDGPNANFFSSPILNETRLVVPTICIFEVFKFILREASEFEAFEAVAAMKQGLIIPLDENLAIHSANIALKLKLPMADSIVYTAATMNRATLWTQDIDFKGLEGVKYIKKSNS